MRSIRTYRPSSSAPLLRAPVARALPVTPMISSVAVAQRSRGCILLQAPRARFATTTGPMSSSSPIASRYSRAPRPTAGQAPTDMLSKDQMAERLGRLAKDIGLLFRDGQPVKLTAMFQKEGIRYNTRTVNGVIASWARSRLEKRHENCEKVVQLMTADGLRPDTWTYEKLISVAGSLGMIDKVLEYRDSMKRDGVEFDAVAYNHTIGIMCQYGKEQDAYELYQEMLAANHVPVSGTFGIMMNTFRKNAAIFEGLWVDMQRLGVRPDGPTVNLLMQHEGSKPGGFTRAKALFDEHVSRLPTDPLSIRCYTTMISVATTHRQTRVAREVLSEMRSRRMQLDLPAANSVINLLGVAGDLEGVEAVWEDIKRHNIEPGGVTYRVMAKAYAMAGDGERAMSFLRKLLSTPQGARLLAEDTGISHMLLKCFAKARDMKKSAELFETLNKLGVVPDHGVWRWFVEIPLRCGKPDVAIRMWRHMQDAGFELEDPLLSEMKAVTDAQPIALEKLARIAGITAKTSATQPPE